jgi:nucleotide sugar dehydrogenase
MSTIEQRLVEMGSRSPLLRGPSRTGDIAVVGLGYVGLPTAIGLATGGHAVCGIDLSKARLGHIRDGKVDLSVHDRKTLSAHLGERQITLSSDPRVMASCSAIIICVPTPVDDHLVPDLSILEAACSSVVQNARAGQTIILTSTCHVGATRDLLVRPLQMKGLTAGRDVFVAFAPERIDPGNADHDQAVVPRVVGGASAACSAEAASLLRSIAPAVHAVSSLEAAELTKLHENTFRAVNCALANELAGAATAHGVDPLEVLEAAATKPFGYMPFYPGPGVGGHCISSDPHYLIWGLKAKHVRAPLMEEAMGAIAARPDLVVERATQLLGQGQRPVSKSRALIVGVTYKPGVRDVRESPALRVIAGLRDAGVTVSYHDPLVEALDIDADLALLSVGAPKPDDYDLVVVCTVQSGLDRSFLERSPVVLDATYKADIQHSVTL